MGIEPFSFIDEQFAVTLLKGKEEGKTLLQYLSLISRNGHLCLQKKADQLEPCPTRYIEDPLECLRIKEKILGDFFALDPSLCSDVLTNGSMGITPLCRLGDCIYLQKNWVRQKALLEDVGRLMSAKLSIELSPGPLDSRLNTAQRSAVVHALSNPLSFISGGPGTGKTFTAAEIVRSFIQALPADKKKSAKVRLSAPTGKAASLLEDKITRQVESSLSIECGTLHSFLKKRGSSLGFPTHCYADLWLIDEASMMDSSLFFLLFSSLAQGGRVVFMGDRDQLPPVESGSFFADLIDLPLGIPVAYLTQSLRSRNEEIPKMAQSILSQDFAALSLLNGVDLKGSLSLKKILEDLCQAYRGKFLPEDLSQAFLQLESFKVLSCIRRGPLGVDSLNEAILHKLLEEQSSNGLVLVPILITANNFDLGLMNGDAGFLLAKASSLKTKTYTFEDRVFFPGDREFPLLALPSFELGYCLSVHKSQGSEYDAVYVLAPRGSEKFGKEILYTAVTRSRSSIRLLSEESIIKAILSKSSQKNSGLSQVFHCKGLIS